MNYLDINFKPMSFNERIKKEVKKKSGFACCCCQITSMSVEVHHIIPESEGGSDTFENAAALCPKCHADYGDNQQKRKAIKERRDWWYEIVEKKYTQQDFVHIGSLLEPKALNDLKNELKEFFNEKIERINNLTATDVFVSNTASTMVAGTEIRTKIYDLEKESNELKEKLDFKDRLVFKNGAFWLDGKEDPICSCCWEDKEKIIHLHQEGNPAYYFCPLCKSEVYAKPELDILKSQFKNNFHKER